MPAGRLLLRQAERQRQRVQQVPCIAACERPSSWSAAFPAQAA